MEKTLHIHLDSTEHTGLLNALRVARDRFLENARTLHAVADTGGNPFIHADGARATAKDFEAQAKQAEMISSFIENMTGPLVIKAVIDPEDEEEEEIAA